MPHIVVQYSAGLQERLNLDQLIAALRYSLALSTGLIGPIAFVTLWLGLRQYRSCYQQPVVQ